MAQETLVYSSTVSDDTGGAPSRLSALDGGFFLMQTVGHAVIIELTNLTGNVGTINYIQHTIHGNGIMLKLIRLILPEFKKRQVLNVPHQMVLLHGQSLILMLYV